MDLYLLSPVFLKKMIRRPSATAGDLPEGGQDRATSPAASKEEEVDGCCGGEALSLLSHYAECDSRASEGEEELDAIAWRRRRRSSLDRVLRQHAYIIICALCYACNLLGHSRT